MWIAKPWEAIPPLQKSVQVERAATGFSNLLQQNSRISRLPGWPAIGAHDPIFPSEKVVGCDVLGGTELSTARGSPETHRLMDGV